MKESVLSKVQAVRDQVKQEMLSTVSSEEEINHAELSTFVQRRLLVMKEILSAVPRMEIEEIGSFVKQLVEDEWAIIQQYGVPKVDTLNIDIE